MKNNSMKKWIGLFLAVLMFIPSARLFAAAETEVIVGVNERAEALEAFNTSANAIKTLRPYMKMESHIALTDATTGSKGDGESLDANGKKYLAWILDACLAPDSGIAQTLFNTINDVPRLPKEAEFVYGEKRDNRLPLAGERYVSALTPADDFVIKRDSFGGTLLHPENEISVTRIEFPATRLEDSENSSLSRLFDLPSPVLNPVIVGSDPNAYDKDGLLSDIHFQEFTFENAFAEAQFDADGNIKELTESVEYTFEVSLYDMLRLITAYTGVDWIGIAIAGIANPILSGLGKEGLTPEDALDLYTIYVTYTSYVHMSDINWNRRYFGDVDNNLAVDSFDARAILRHAVGLELITNQLSQVYADMNFDGTVSPEDARLALRTAVGLEEKMLTPPDGKNVGIIIIDEIDEPVVPDDPGSLIIEGDPDASEEPAPDDYSSELAGFTGSILDIINAIRNDKDAGASGIRKIVEEFQNLLGDG